jgi:hypothetical protein
MNTSLKAKKKYLPEFTKKMWEGLTCGGTRYALTEDKEMTDLIVELVGSDWIVGNIIKYAAEYKNCRTKHCLYKIANYAFILSLIDKERLEEGDEGEK